MTAELRKPATQKDVARLAGVSQAAVSRWISGRGYVAADVREQIIRAVTELDYRPHPFAQGLSSGQSDMVAVVMANISNPGYQVMLEKITQALQAKNLQTLLFNASSAQTVDDLVPNVLRYRVRGAIITTSQLSSTAARQLASQGVPTVLLHRYTKAGGVHSVLCDNMGGGRLAADTLLRAGARRVAFIGGNPDSSTSTDRKAGFLQQLQQWNAEAVATQDGEFTYEWGAAATIRLFEVHPDIDGLFCADDEIATGAIDALRHQLGKQIPKDVKVVGFDDHPISSKSAYALTTIRQPFDEMIDKAVNLLLEGDARHPATELLKGTLIARRSA